MTAIPKPEKTTAEEYFKRTENIEERTELIDGQIVAMASPSRTHQRISSHLHHLIEDYIRANHGDCEVNEALNAYLDDFNVPIPDVMVVCDPGKMDDSGCHGAPDWVVEITSTNWHNDYRDKLIMYRQAGVREYWIVDTQKQIICVYFFEHSPNVVSIYNWSDEIPVGIYSGQLKIRIEDMV